MIRCNVYFSHEEVVVFKPKASKAASKSIRSGQALLEGLENRQLLSASALMYIFGRSRFAEQTTAQFQNLLPAVQTGLDNLAGSTISSTKNVNLGNSDGVETFSVTLKSTGTKTTYEVDENGNPITAPSHSKTTFAAVNSNVSTEINAIATAENLTAPTTATKVQVNTAINGVTTYSVNLTPVTSSTGRHHHTPPPVTVTVDSAGDPLAPSSLPFSVMLPAVQSTFEKNAPSGVTLTSSSTNAVNIQTIDGTIVYSMTFKSAGSRTTLYVDAAGTLVNLPSSSQVTLANVPSAAATELQTLATADGATGTFATTQTFTASAEPNGTTIFTVDLTISKHDKIAVSVDQLGNPTVPSSDIGISAYAGLGGGTNC
jgi:hypothetical protein